MQGDFRIGDRMVVPTLNQIRHGGAPVHVEPKAMRVLLHLAARGGEVAGREELIKEVWPDTFVTDDVLKRCIPDLRKALGDDRRNPRFIETIPKVGYRLLTAVEPAETSGKPRPAPLLVPTSTPPPHTHGTRRFASRGESRVETTLPVRTDKRFAVSLIPHIDTRNDQPLFAAGRRPSEQDSVSRGASRADE